MEADSPNAALQTWIEEQVSKLDFEGEAEMLAKYMISILENYLSTSTEGLSAQAGTRATSGNLVLTRDQAIQGGLREQCIEDLKDFLSPDVTPKFVDALLQQLDVTPVVLEGQEDNHVERAQEMAGDTVEEVQAQKENDVGVKAAKEDEIAPQTATLPVAAGAEVHKATVPEPQAKDDGAMHRTRSQDNKPKEPITQPQPQPQPQPQTQPQSQSQSQSHPHPQPSAFTSTPQVIPDSPAMNTRRVRWARTFTPITNNERPALPLSSPNGAAAGSHTNHTAIGANRRSAKREAALIQPDGDIAQTTNEAQPQQTVQLPTDVINVDTFVGELQPPRTRRRLGTNDQPTVVERIPSAIPENGRDDVAIVQENIVRHRSRLERRPVAIQSDPRYIRASFVVHNEPPVVNENQSDRPPGDVVNNSDDDDIVIVSVTRAPRGPATHGTTRIRTAPWERPPYISNLTQPVAVRADELSSESESEGDYDDEDAMGDDSDDDARLAHLMDDDDSDDDLSEDDHIPWSLIRPDRLSAQARDREVLRSYEQWPEPQVTQSPALPRIADLRASGHGSGYRRSPGSAWRRLVASRPVRTGAPGRAPRTISTSAGSNGNARIASPPQRDEGATGFFSLLDRIRYYAPQWMADGPTRIPASDHHGVDYHSTMMRLGERASYEQLLGLDRFLPNRNGASDSVIRNIPTVAATKDDETEKCTICLEEMKEGVSIKRLPCNNKHIFHPDCIDRWLQQNGVCPIDKRRVDEAARTAANAAKTGLTASRPPRSDARSNQAATAGPSGQPRGESSRARAASGGVLAGITTSRIAAAARSRAAASTGVILPEQSPNNGVPQQRQPGARSRRRA